jgi:hypothetical protein
MVVPLGFRKDPGKDDSESLYDTLMGLDTEVKDQISRDLTHEEMKKRFSRVPEPWWNKLKNRPLHYYPDLSSLVTKIIFVQKGKVGFLKDRIRQLALDALMSEIDLKPGVDPSARLNSMLWEYSDEVWCQQFDEGEISQELQYIQNLHCIKNEEIAVDVSHSDLNSVRDAWLQSETLNDYSQLLLLGQEPPD